MRLNWGRANLFKRGMNFFYRPLKRDLPEQSFGGSAVTGFLPSGWIVLNVIFLYRLTVEKGLFETLQNTIGGVEVTSRECGL